MLSLNSGFRSGPVSPRPCACATAMLRTDVAPRSGAGRTRSGRLVLREKVINKQKRENSVVAQSTNPESSLIPTPFLPGHRSSVLSSSSPSNQSHQNRRIPSPSASASAQPARRRGGNNDNHTTRQGAGCRRAWNGPAEGDRSGGLGSTGFPLLQDVGRIKRTAPVTFAEGFWEACAVKCWDCQVTLCDACVNWQRCSIPRRPRPWEPRG